jgi:hypothetical protein
MVTALVGLVYLPVRHAWQRWRYEHDPSVVLGHRWEDNGEEVQDGWAYDRAVLDLRGGVVLVVPQDAEVVEGGSGDRVEVYMEKVLASGVHLGGMSIRDVRRKLGCAWRVEGGRLWLATYGEWNSHFEGGAYMFLVLRVPGRVRVERHPGLAGDESLAHRREPGSEKWWEPTVAPGWHALPDVPDAEHKARALAGD